MLGTATISGSGKHTLANLSDAERQAAQRALARLNQPGRGLGSHLGGITDSATVSSGSVYSQDARRGLGSSTLIHGQLGDTFIGGVRGARTTFGTGTANDTVVSGSTSRTGFHSGSHTPSEHGVRFSLSSDTINVAGATAAGIQAGRTPETTGAHTITLADKTTITIAGLSPHDITKLHH